MDKKNKNYVKMAIIAVVVLAVGLIGFLVYDEVRSNNYLKELNAIINDMQEYKVGNVKGESYSYPQGSDKLTESDSKVVRESDFSRTDKGITFRETTKEPESGKLVSDVYLRPGEYYMIQDGEEKWTLSKIEEGIDARPYSMGPTARPVVKSDFKRIKKVEVDGKEAFELALSGQWMMTNYMGGQGKPISGHIIYIVGEQDGKTVITETRRTLDIRLQDEEGKNMIQVMEDDSFFEGNVALDGGDPIEALDKFYKENIEGNFEEAKQEPAPAPAEKPAEEKPAEGEKSEESSDEEKPADDKKSEESSEEKKSDKE